MNNFVEDIVNDYKLKLSKGVTEVYYKKDLIEGLKIIFTVIGLVKIGFAVGSVALSGLSALVHLALGNPGLAGRVGREIYDKREEIRKLISQVNDKLNEKYKKLSDDDKKKVRTVVLFVAKGGVSWGQLL